MIDIGFEWTRGLEYELVGEGAVRAIRQVSLKSERYQPLSFDSKTPLYARFAKLDGSPESCLQCARAWGLLRTRATPDAVEPISDWQREIKKMRSTMSILATADEKPGGAVRTANSRRTRFKLTSIDVALISGELDYRDENSGRPILVLQPRTLLDAMHLQLGKFVASDGSLQVCKQCGEWFERGASESRRSIAIFCSEKCKNRFHYLERSKR
jgi:hypothetical protein